MSIRPLRLSTERFILVLVEDLTMERRQILLMDTIRRAKQEWELTFDTVTDLICTIDHRYRVLRLNRAMADKVGIPIRDGVGQACYKLVHGSSAPPPFCPYPKAFSAGREASVEYFEEQLGAYLSESLCPIRGEPGHPIGCVLVTRDISERKELENQLQFRATRDALTGLLNRSHFLELLKAAFETAKRYVHPLSVCIADIDLFKAINDQHGHKAGDAVLVRFSQILLSELRQSDLSARYGGDEFIIALPHTPARKAAESMDRLRKGLEAVHFESGSRSWTATCSVGVAEFSARAMNIESLIAEADRALYEAKNRGRNRVVVLVG
jgi:diguanylate cyclase (GGDEF)-like protein